MPHEELGPGSARRVHSASKTRVNALSARRAASGTRDRSPAPKHLPSRPLAPSRARRGAHWRGSRVSPRMLFSCYLL